MGMKRNTYIGSYLKVWLSEQPRDDSMDVLCLTCGEMRRSNYCHFCGEKLHRAESRMSDDLHSYMLDLFDDTEYFRGLEVEDEDFEIAMPNASCVPGGMYLKDDMPLEHELPAAYYFEGVFWAKLIEHFDNNGIKYKTRLGVVSWKEYY